MRIFNLILDNFQCFTHKQLDFVGCSADIFGDNAVGKSTIGNSINWLFFDKALDDIKNYSPKPKDDSGHGIHNLDTSVEADISLDSGRRVTLRKVLKENWVKKRGAAESEFSGHTIEYFIDGVPTKEKDYTFFLQNNIGDLERMRCLMRPGGFSEEWSWQERRAVLLAVCGDVSDEQVIAGTLALRELPAVLRKLGESGELYTVEEYQKIAKAQMADLNKELQTLPARIDEARKAIPEITDGDRAALQVDIGAIISEKAHKETELMRFRRGGDGALADMIGQKERELEIAKGAYLSKQNAKNDTVNSEITQLRKQIFTFQADADGYSRDEAQARVAITKKKKEREILLSEFKESKAKYESAQALGWQGDTLCPTCGQPLPAAQLEDSRAKFNAMRARRLEDAKVEMDAINQRGKAADFKGAIETLEKSAETAVVARKDAVAQLEALEKKLADLQQRIVTPAPYESTDEYATRTGSIDWLRNDAAAAASAQVEKTSAMQAEIDGLAEQQNRYMAVKQKQEMAKTQRQRILDLESREKEISTQYEKFEHGVYLCEEFTRAKVSMLDDRINSRFHSVRFRLFQEQINGGLKECCEALVPGESGMVPYGEANNAGRINAGLEIIGVLAAHWGFTMPVIVDNAESVTRLNDPGTQLIRLVVSEADKTLRMVTHQETQNAA